MQDEFSSFSFGALRKAQQTLNRIHSESSSGKEYDNSYSVEDQRSGGATGKEIPRKDDLHLNESKEGTVFTSRKSKNAPIEITSKRPVSRRRTVVEIEKLEVRDPRFSQLSGEFDATKFQNHYSFLSDMHQGELRMLRENLNRARKLLASSPRDLFPERVAEVERLALAVKRAESSVSRDKREKVEYEALSVVAKDEREKQQKGKKAYWLKNAEKKKLLIKARFDAMTAQGGTRALKKVIEKKRRKLSQKETKSRPFSQKTGPALTPTRQASRKRDVTKDGSL